MAGIGLNEDDFVRRRMHGGAIYILAHHRAPVTGSSYTMRSHVASALVPVGESVRSFHLPTGYGVPAVSPFRIKNWVAEATGGTTSHRSMAAPPSVPVSAPSVIHDPGTGVHAPRSVLWRSV